MTEEKFHPVIDAHLHECEIAGREAHDYYCHNEDDRPISIERTDPNGHVVDTIQNLGSYIGEYIRAHGKPRFERGLDELVFRAVVWASGTRMVRFSNGANELIDQDRQYVKKETPETKVTPNPDFDPESHASPDSKVAPFDVENPGWAIIGVARVVDDEEQVFEIEQNGVVWREIEAASHLDPPKRLSDSRTRERVISSTLSTYNG